MGFLLFCLLGSPSYQSVCLATRSWLGLSCEYLWAHAIPFVVWLVRDMGMGVSKNHCPQNRPQYTMMDTYIYIYTHTHALYHPPLQGLLKRVSKLAAHLPKYLLHNYMAYSLRVGRKLKSTWQADGWQWRGARWIQLLAGRRIRSVDIPFDIPCLAYRQTEAPQNLHESHVDCWWCRVPGGSNVVPFWVVYYHP